MVGRRSTSNSKSIAIAKSGASAPACARAIATENVTCTS